MSVGEDQTQFHHENESRKRKVCGMAMQATLTCGEQDEDDPFFDTEDNKFFDTISVGIVDNSTLKLNNSPLDATNKTGIYDLREGLTEVLDSGAQPAPALCTLKMHQI